jgi:hypothetical protein
MANIAAVPTGSGVDPCCCATCEVETPPSGAGVFQVSASEFNAYIDGGVWTVSVSEGGSESDTIAGISASGSGSITLTRQQDGCYHDVLGGFDWTYNYTFADGDSLAELRHSSVEFYAEFSCYFNDTTEEWEFYASFSVQAGAAVSNEEPGIGDYPSTRSFIVEGNTLTTIGLWTPTWTPSSAYSNSIATILSVTFAPDP